MAAGAALLLQPTGAAQGATYDGKTGTLATPFRVAIWSGIVPKWNKVEVSIFGVAAEGTEPWFAYWVCDGNEVGDGALRDGGNWRPISITKFQSRTGTLVAVGYSRSCKYMMERGGTGSSVFIDFARFFVFEIPPDEQPQPDPPTQAPTVDPSASPAPSPTPSPTPPYSMPPTPSPTPSPSFCFETPPPGYYGPPAPIPCEMPTPSPSPFVCEGLICIEPGTYTVNFNNTANPTEVGPDAVIPSQPWDGNGGYMSLYKFVRSGFTNSGDSGGMLKWRCTDNTVVDTGINPWNPTTPAGFTWTNVPTDLAHAWNLANVAGKTCHLEIVSTDERHSRTVTFSEGTYWAWNEPNESASPGPTPTPDPDREVICVTIEGAEVCYYADGSGLVDPSASGSPGPSAPTASGGYPGNGGNGGGEFPGDGPGLPGDGSIGGPLGGGGGYVEGGAACVAVYPKPGQLERMPVEVGGFPGTGEGAEPDLLAWLGSVVGGSFAFLANIVISVWNVAVDLVVPSNCLMVEIEAFIVWMQERGPFAVAAQVLAFLQGFQADMGGDPVSLAFEVAGQDVEVPLEWAVGFIAPFRGLMVVAVSGVMASRLLGQVVGIVGGSAGRHAAKGEGL